MDNLNRNSHKQITLQDLLKVKKLEKPNDAFWEKFDEELAQRTLKSLVYKQSLLSHISNGLLFIFKPIFPLAALGLLTIGVFLYNSYSKFPQSHSIIGHMPATCADKNLDFTFAKKNYVKASILMDSPDNGIQANVLDYPSASGIRYLAGNMNAHPLGQGISTNTIY
jgi:hypothetical protein